MYNEVYLIKAASNTLLPLQKTSKYKKFLSFKKTSFDILDFHHAFQIACVHISIVVETDVHIKNSSSDSPTHSCTLHGLFPYDWSKLMICLIFDNIIDTSTWKEINQYYQHIDLKIFFIRYHHSVQPISTLICIHGRWWLRRLVFEDTLDH